MRQLIDSRLWGKLADRMPQTCAIQFIGSTTRGASGQAKNTYVPLEGRESIPCQFSIGYRLGNQESTPPSMTLTSKQGLCRLRGYYPDITTPMQAVIGDVTYNIVSVIPDSQKFQTLLILEAVTT